MGILGIESISCEKASPPSQQDRIHNRRANHENEEVKETEMIQITRREEFCAAHRLYSAKLSEKENKILYDKCANSHYHGHNYFVEVTLRGPLDPDTGMAYNLADLKRIMRREIVDQLDHKNLNEDTKEYMKGKIPTAENIVISIWERLEEHIGRVLLYRVRLFENERNFVDYFGAE